MKLYYISTDIGGYDSYDAHVIAAESEERAMQFAALEAADEGKVAWTPEHATIKVIAEETNQEAGIILSSFNAG